MTPIKTSKGEFLAVKVPDDINDCAVSDTYKDGRLFLNGQNTRTYEMAFHIAVLPPGSSYTFLFCTKEVTEQQAGEVVEIGISGGMDYTGSLLFTDTNTQSLRTLLLAHGLNPEDNHAFLKVNE